MTALVIGGGPAGLMATEALLDAGVSVELAEAKPSLGRKLLMAGKSGLNLSKMQDRETFLSAYGPCRADLEPMLAAFGPDEVRAWAEDLGQSCFIGSSGRLYPEVMKASPLLRAWMARLAGKGLTHHTRWRWTGWQGDALRFETQGGIELRTPKATVLALGGASWARLGSDGAWASWLGADLPLAPFAPSNAGLVIPWSEHMAKHFGTPLKNICLSAGDLSQRGEVVISARGLEGGGLYPLTPALRAGHALHIDLFPDLTHATLVTRLARSRGKQSLSNHLRKVLRLSPQFMALIMEVARPLPSEPDALAQLMKALPLPYDGLRPMDEAISTAGGVPFAEMTAGLMLKARPGVFCAGEMLDWEAPTGGYLLTACLATGLWAGQNAVGFLKP
jgi:uncharacterized flavoprotein (TIGR03862 family)